MIINKKRIILLTAVAAIVVGIFYFESLRPERINTEKININLESKEDKSARYKPAKELVDVQQFINSEPFKLADHIGKKIILMDFWTYSCINCQRTTPYLNAWWERYKDDGLLIVGVHTPEFEFEKKAENVLKAAENLGIKYPVVQDNNYSTWTAYGNRYWPRKYLIDIDGFIVYDHIGEGAYEETEKKIRELLEERKLILGETGKVGEEMAEPTGIQDVSEKPQSPEIYFGAFRNELLANGKSSSIGTQSLTIPSEIPVNYLFLSGTWDIQKEYAESTQSGNKIVFKFIAKQINMVAESDMPSEIRIILDGEEIDKKVIQDSRLYNLADLAKKGEHTIEIIIEEPGLKIYTFTFG